MEFKRRPFIIIGVTGQNDYIVLPISRVTIEADRDAHYDYPLSKEGFILLNLSENSFIRIHKPTTIHEGQISKIITDFSSNYPNSYLEIMSLYEEFQRHIVNNSI